MKEKKICIAASAGGHLTEALALKEAWKGKEHFFISDKRINALGLARKEKVYFIVPSRRNYFKFGISFLQTLAIIIKENPDVILSTGAEIGYPALLAGHLLGKKTIYIETLARVNSASLCGKLVHDWVDYFYVQWPEGKKWFHRARYVGSVLE